MVSTITESYFVENFKSWGQECFKSIQWLQLRVANGLAILYIGYMVLDVELCGKTVPGCGILVVRDLPRNMCAQVLGKNVLSRCYWDLFSQHGPALFEFPPVVAVSGSVMQAFQHCHGVKSQSTFGQIGNARARGRRLCRVVP